MKHLFFSFILFISFLSPSLKADKGDFLLGGQIGGLMFDSEYNHDYSLGFSSSANAEILLTRQFSICSDLNYNYFSFSRYINAEETMQSIGLNIGAKYYFKNPTKNTSFYCGLSIGPVYKFDDYPKDQYDYNKNVSGSSATLIQLKPVIGFSTSITKKTITQLEISYTPHFMIDNDYVYYKDDDLVSIYTYFQLRLGFFFNLE